MNQSRAPLHLAAFVLGTLAAGLLFRGAILDLVRLALADERYTHTLVTPGIALAFVWPLRRDLLSSAAWAPLAGLPFGAAAALLAAFAPTLPASLAALVLTLAGLFWACFGGPNLLRARFPFVLLALMIPWPEALVGAFESFLQRTSAECTHLLFWITRTPFHREGLQFALPGVTIEVARECSGIRSSNALLLTSLVLGQLFLQASWRHALLVVATIPVTILKNAIRIAGLSWLGLYVSRDFLLGELHRQGGALFAALGLLLIIPILFALIRAEQPLRPAKSASASG